MNLFNTIKKNKFKLNKVTRQTPYKVFLAMSPLHIVILSNILDRYDQQDDSIVIMLLGNADQLDAFAQRYLKDRKFISISRKNNILSSIKLMIRVRSLGGSVGEVYTPLLKSPFSRCLILSARNFRKSGSLNTYDDGFGNIAGSGYLYTVDQKINHVLLGLMFRSLSYEKLRERIDKHYTIFLENNAYDLYAKEKIFIEPEFLAIDVPELSKDPKILLTQPFSETGLISLDNEIGLYREAIEKFNLKYRLAHPAEEKRKTKLLEEIIETINYHGIAEEFLVSITKSRRDVYIYGFNSTTLFTTANIRNLHRVWIKNKTVPLLVPTNEEFVELH